jgi:hypothetical protein
MIGRLMEMLDSEVIGLYGNHDCADPRLNDHDSLSLLVKAGTHHLAARGVGLNPNDFGCGGVQAPKERTGSDLTTQTIERQGTRHSASPLFQPVKSATGSLSPQPPTTQPPRVRHGRSSACGSDWP